MKCLLYHHKLSTGSTVFCHLFIFCSPCSLVLKSHVYIINQHYVLYNFWKLIKIIDCVPNHITTFSFFMDAEFIFCSFYTFPAYSLTLPTCSLYSIACSGSATVTGRDLHSVILSYITHLVTSANTEQLFTSLCNIQLHHTPWLAICCNVLLLQGRCSSRISFLAVTNAAVFSFHQIFCIK